MFNICDLCNTQKKQEDFKEENGWIYCNDCVELYRLEKKEYKSKKLQRKSKEMFTMELDYQDMINLRRLLTLTKFLNINESLLITKMRILIKTKESLNS